MKPSLFPHALAALALSASPASAVTTGPSSSTVSFVEPANTLWTSHALLTVGDAAPNGYRLVGIPDGMGAYDNGDGTFTLLVNHELGATAGVARAHGAKGAFVSKWRIEKTTLKVLSGEDLIKTVKAYNKAAGAWETVPSGDSRLAFGRFCSADLPAVTAFFHAASGKGTQARIFMNGEEIGAEGRGMAHVVTGPEAGTSYELPALGRYSWENSVACPVAQEKTVVIGTDDGTGGQVYVYIGDKRSTGNEVEKAGLAGGKLYGIKVTGYPTELTTQTPASARVKDFTLVDLGDYTLKTGANLETESVAAGVTTFNRPEDGAWDPRNPNTFYFVSTASQTTPCRLWCVTFANIAQPELGGTIEICVDGQFDGATPVMFDNLTINTTGQVLIQEDPGNFGPTAKIHSYDIASKKLTTVATHSPKFFTTGQPNFLTADEESSGIIDAAEFFGPDYYLFNVQAHTPATGPNAAELVEKGQILLLGPSTRSINMSGRSRVGSGEKIMVAGFVISGTEPKQVLVRALGQTLKNFGLTGVLNNPRLELFNAQRQKFAENDNWKTNTNQAAIAASGFAPENEADAAVLLTLQPGLYTAQASDVGGSAGVALVDVYEIESKPAHNTTRVVNLSVRGETQSGENVLVGGFVIEGREPKKVIIRALGPTLRSFGLSDVVGDPVLKLFDRNRQVVAKNDDWIESASAVSQYAATPQFQPGAAVEATLALTLEPGLYTVQVENVGGGGVTLLDVNEVD